jgi:hypothetical protein
MKAWIWAWLSVCGMLLAAGCVSQAKAREDVKKAYLAGQGEAMARMQRNLGQSVIIQGQVRQSFLPWTRELTLAKAIVAAGYYGPEDPKEITIIRNDEEVPVDMQRLLSGEDYPLAPGDTIRIK